MIICPMCEHPQADGFECEVCGRALLSLDPLPPPPADPVEGLEQTGGGAAGPVAVEAMPEFEASRFAPVLIPVQAAPDVEHTSEVVVGEVPVERMADMSEDRAAPVGPATVLSAGPVQCRYCGQPQGAGAICERCGMRLPRKAGVPVVAAAPVRRKREPERVRCRKCGAPAKEGGRCGDCGTEVPWRDD